MLTSLNIKIHVLSSLLNKKYQNLRVSAKKGTTLIWPTDFTHTHRSQISPTQEKYIATGWYEFQ